MGFHLYQKQAKTRRDQWQKKEKRNKKKVAVAFSSHTPFMQLLGYLADDTRRTHVADELF